MLFDSPIFFAFLALVVPVYWRLRHRQQNLFLLGASYIFYGWWDYRFLGLIAASTLVDFLCARAIETTARVGKRRMLLAFSLIVNFAFLGFFKYFNFFADSLVHALATVGIQASPRAISILLPPGISFYTFQAVAYIVDVYFRRIRAAESLVDYALFISLFPHLIAGPIQRPDHLLPQVQRPRSYSTSKAFDGLLLILTGLFRKCVVADSCALIANAAFGGQLGPPSLGVVLLGTYAFAWQIYGDFSGYSDIARGSAQLLGFHFMVNFRQPYFATSLQDFWRRWHISLSTWLRDYLYFPLGGNRHGEVLASRNLFLTMLLGGLWHGANWTFVVWGALHGSWLAIERAVRRAFSVRQSSTHASPRTAWRAAAQRVVIFHVVCLSWIFFRADSVSSALTFLGGVSVLAWNSQFATVSVFLAMFITPLVLVDGLLERRTDEYPFASGSYVARLTVAAALVISLLTFSANQASAFIYFQF